MSASYSQLASRAAALDQQLSALLERNTPLLTPCELCDLWYLRWLCTLLRKKALARATRSSLPAYRDLTPPQLFSSEQ